MGLGAAWHRGKVVLPRERITLCPVGADDGHGADPVRRDLGYQRIKNFEAGCIHDQDFRIMAVAQEPPFPLCANCELIELHRWTPNTN